MLRFYLESCPNSRSVKCRRGAPPQLRPCTAHSSSFSDSSRHEIVISSEYEEWNIIQRVFIVFAIWSSSLKRWILRQKQHTESLNMKRIVQKTRQTRPADSQTMLQVVKDGQKSEWVRDGNGRGIRASNVTLHLGRKILWDLKDFVISQNAMTELY